MQIQTRTPGYTQPYAHLPHKQDDKEKFYLPFYLHTSIFAYEVNLSLEDLPQPGHPSTSQTQENLENIQEVATSTISSLYY